MKRKILIYVGSFKPPHKGHYNLIRRYMNKFDKIYIIISNKSRPLDRRLKDIESLSLNEINSILKIDSRKKSNAINIYRDMLDSGKNMCIDSKQSEKVWRIYIKYLDKLKISLMISPLRSPVNFAMRIYNSIDKNKNEVVFLKSEKNRNNSRFGDKVQLIGKYFNRISSTDMRELILYDKIDKFYKYLPDILSDRDKKIIWNILKKRK